MNYHNLSFLVKDYLLGGPALTLVTRDIVGLYLEKEQLQYACMSMTHEGWAPKSPAASLEPFGSIQASAPWSLKQFLEWLTVVPLMEAPTTPRKKAIYLTLPRNSFSARDLQLPPMSMEDALESVKNSLPVNCHLSPDEMYYDIHLCRTIQGNINALIVYASRKDMDVYLNIFRETDLLDSFRGVFPVSFGIGAWLDMQRYPMPVGLILPQDKSFELTVYQKGGCLFSGTWPVSEGKDGGEILIAAVKAKFDGLDGNLFHMDNNSPQELPLPSPNYLEQLPLITENMAMAAAAPALVGQQEISVDGTSPRLAIFQPLRLLIPLALLLCLILFLLYGKAKWWDLPRLQEKQETLSLEIKELKNKLDPLEQKRKIFRKTNRFRDDANRFLETRPRLFSLINEVARHMPEGTWFSHFSFQRNTMTLKGESLDTLQAIEALRTSPMFLHVILKGTVSKNTSGTERFSITIKLEDLETNETDK